MSRESITEEYKRLMARLRSGALRLFGRPDDVEDALHDAFSALWSRAADDSHPRSLMWEFEHRMASESMRRYRHPHTEFTEEMYYTPPPDDVGDTFRLIEQIIEKKLSPLHRDILRRREYQHQSISEIASTLGMKEPAVRMNLSRARRTIRETYNRIEHDTATTSHTHR